MTDWDKTDLLARVRRDSRTPANATFPADSDFYAWLTRAEALWKPKLAGIYPYHMFTAPTLMVTSDSGLTYSISGEASPLAIEVYASTNGPRLIAGQFDDPNADYVWEGSQIRMTNATARTYSAGPYARYVAGPAGITASVDSAMKPLFTRQLLVDRALIYWARTNEKDASDFESQEIESWGQIQEALKQSNMFYGDASNRRGRRISGISYLGLRGR